MSDLQRIEAAMDGVERLFRVLPFIVAEFGNVDAFPTGTDAGDVRIIADAMAALNRAFGGLAGMKVGR